MEIFSARRDVGGGGWGGGACKWSLENRTHLKISKYLKLGNTVLTSCIYWHLLPSRFPHPLLHAPSDTLSHPGFPVKMTHPSAESSSCLKYPGMSHSISWFSFNLNGIRLRDVQLKDSWMGGGGGVGRRHWWGYLGNQQFYRNENGAGGSRIIKESDSPEGEWFTKKD